MVEVGAYYYLWYDEAQWKEYRYVHMPHLGLYDSSRPEVISQHIEWAKRYNIKFFLVSWDGPENEGKKIDRNLRNAFLTNPATQEIKFAILYESEARLKRIPSDIMNLSDPNKLNQLVNDFDYIASNYFNDGRYYRIDGKPLVALYLSRDYKGDVKEAVRRLRRNTLYLVGDEVYYHTVARDKWRRWKRPTLGNREEFIRLYDAVTAYNMHEEPSPVEKEHFDKNFDSNVEREYADWLRALPDEVDFIPNAIPGFDDTKIPQEHRPRRHTPLLRSASRLDKQLEIATRSLQRGNILLITSFNEWHEDTQIEPGRDYPPPETPSTYLEPVERHSMRR
jgi:hypothetical protein